MKLDSIIIQNLVPLYEMLPDDLFDAIVNESSLKKAKRGDNKQEIVWNYLNNSSPYNGKRRKPITIWQYFVFQCAEKDESIDSDLFNIMDTISKIANIDNEALLRTRLKKYTESAEFIDFISASVDTNEEKNYEIGEDSNQNTKEDIKVKYIGYIKKDEGPYSDFYNFYPIYELTEDNRIILIEDPAGLFPTIGNIYINFGRNLKSKEQLLQWLKECDIKLFVLQFESDELKDYKKSTGEFYPTNKKLDCFSIEDFNRRFSLLSENGIYPVVETRKTPEEFNNPSVEYDIDIFSLDGEKVFVKSTVNNRYYGPYEINCSTDLPYAKNNLSDSNGLLNTYSDETYPIKYKDGKIDFIQYDASKSQYEDIYLRDDKALLLSFINSQKEQGEIGIVADSIMPIIDSLKKSAFSSTLPEKIRNDRIDRIKIILSQITENDDFNSEIISLVQSILYNNKNNDNIKGIIKILSENSSALKEIRKEIDNKETTILELEDKKSRLEKQIEDKKNTIEQLNEQKGTLEKIDQAKIDDKRKEYDDISAQLDELKKEYYGLKNLKEIRAEYERLEKNRDELLVKKNNLETDYAKEEAKCKKKLNESIEDLKSKEAEAKNAKEQAEKLFNDYLDDKKRDIQELAFKEHEKAIASRLIESAAEWGNVNNEKEIEKYTSEIINPDNCRTAISRDKGDLIDYLCNSIKEYRPNYTDNQIKNILICIANNFLTIFSGNPGTGKTSICNIIAHVMGLNSLKIDGVDSSFTDRFASIAVERNWTSKRDFIGYYNPLTKTFDKSNSKIYDGLRILNHEGKNSIYPYFILLDEANLSPLEYYWSDFMSLADNDGSRDMKIDLGNGFVFNIPETLRFLATINNDHTTEPLSPRVIDRSWIITLPEIKSAQAKKLDFSKDEPIIMWDAFVAAFKNNDSDDNFKDKDRIEGIYQLFEAENIPISSRTRQQITSYIKVAQRVFGEEANTTTAYVAIDYAILQKLLPQINGCRTSFITALEKLCGEEGSYFPMSFKKLKQIENRCGDMDYCSFF